MIDKERAMLIDVQYIRPNREDNPDGLLYVIWKDIDTNAKRLEIIEDPKMEIFFTKPEYRDHVHNKNYEHIEKCNKKVVPYKDIIKEIVEDGGPPLKQKLDQIYRSRSFRDMNTFHMYPYVYGSDFDIRSMYRYQWLQTLDNQRVKKPTNGFLDIEVDGLEVPGVPTDGTCPIDLVSIMDASEKIMYTFALIGVTCKEKDMKKMSKQEQERELKRRKMYASRIEQQNYLVEHQNEMLRDLHEKNDELYGEEIDYRFFFYQDEKKMLIHIFELIHRLKLDFMKIWNISYDIPYIIERLKALGMDPTEVMCHPDFPVKYCKFKKDTRNYEIKNKNDHFECTDYTIWRCQMEDFAGIRKGQEELRGFKLGQVGKRVLCDDKYDYSEDGNIKTISYENYWKYFIYNIKDVLLQYGIELRTRDSDYIWMLSYLNATPYESIFRQTVKLRNVQYISFREDGLIPGANINMMVDEKSEDELDKENEAKEGDDKFEGALVGDPRLILPVGMEMYGRKQNNIFRYSIDMDMGRFYPSSICAMNIDPSTLIFKCICDPRQYDVMGGFLKFNGITHYSKIESPTAFDIGDLAKEIVDNYQTGNAVCTATKWFNAPTVDSLIEDMDQMEDDFM